MVAFLQTLPIRIPLVIIIKVTGKLLCIFRMIHLIIPFDRGCEYCSSNDSSI